METWLALFKEGGLVLVFASALCTILFFIIKHFLDQSRTIFNAFIAAQADFLKVNAGWQRALDAHNAAAIEFHSRSAEADRFQREEHKEICANLQMIRTDITMAHTARHEEHLDLKNRFDQFEKVIEKCEAKA